MARTSSVYYIAPSSISIVPNCNGTASDLAVTISRGAKVRVYYPSIFALGMEGSAYQEWTLAGRNRRLAEAAPYTIYARLRMAEDPTSSASLATAHAYAYLVFARQEKDADGKWTDPYILSPNPSATSPLNNVTGADGNKYSWPPIPVRQTENGRTGFWWVKMGTVSAPDENNQRTVDLDTGILGTEEYNNRWRLNPDDLPDNPVRTVITDRGTWAQTPHVIYRGPTGTRTPDGTLPAATAAALGWQGTGPLTFTNGEPIAEPYHRDSLTRHRFIAKRLSSENAALTDADLYEKLTTVSKGWEEENELETSRAWLGDKLWECLVDRTQQQPGLDSTDWRFVSGNTNWRIDFLSSNGSSFYYGHVETTVIARLYWGQDDITEKVGAEAFSWTRSTESGKTAADETWDAQAAHQGTNVLQLRSIDMPTAWSRNNKAVFTCTARVNDGTEDLEIENQIIA